MRGRPQISSANPGQYVSLSPIACLPTEKAARNDPDGLATKNSNNKHQKL